MDTALVTGARSGVGRAIARRLGPLIQLDEIADAAVRPIRDETLAGRVLFLRGGREPRLLPPDDPLEWP